MESIVPYSGTVLERGKAWISANTAVLHMVSLEKQKADTLYIYTMDLQKKQLPLLTLQSRGGLLGVSSRYYLAKCKMGPSRLRIFETIRNILGSEKVTLTTIILDLDSARKSDFHSAVCTVPKASKSLKNYRKQPLKIQLYIIHKACLGGPSCPTYRLFSPARSHPHLCLLVRQRHTCWEYAWYLQLRISIQLLSHAQGLQEHFKGG